MTSLRVVLAAALLAGPLLTPVHAQQPDSLVGQVNTLWVIPELHHAWVEPLLAYRVGGGGLWNVGGFVRGRSLAESIRNAIGYLSSHPAACPGFAEAWRQYDLFLTWSDPDQPRDGPSAGLAIAVAAYSAMIERPVRQNLGVTGELLPDGRVLGVGGVPDKIDAAVEWGLETLCLPADGSPDPSKMGLDQALAIRLVAVERAEEALFEAFGQDGPDSQRYRRIVSLWRDVRQAVRERRDVACRLAVDELVELAPNDLSAEAVRVAFSAVDMRPAAANLFADAAQQERAGNRDAALRLARRAARYADEATRQRHGAMLERLERGGLPAAAQAVIEQAESLEARGDLAAGYRLIEQLAREQGDNRFVQAYLTRWSRYRLVADLVDAVATAPESIELRAQLAAAYEAVGYAWRAAEAYALLRARQPESSRWVLAEATARVAAGRPAAAAGVLRAVRPKWPDLVDDTVLALGLELTPPQLSLSPLQRDGAVATALVRSIDDSGLPELTVYVGDRPMASGRLSPALLQIDLGALPAGTHLLRVTSNDRYDNEAVATARLDVPPQVTGPAVRELPSGLRPAADYLVPAMPEARLVVGQGARLVIDGPAWFPDVAGRLSAVTAAGRKATGPPFRLELETTERPPGEWSVTVTAEVSEGAAPAARTLVVELVPEPPAALLAPTAGTVLQGTSNLTIGVAEPGQAKLVTVLVDGWPHLRGPADEPVRLDASRLAPGEHHLAVTVEDSAGRLLVAPPVTVAVSGGQSMGPRVRLEMLAAPTTAAALSATTDRAALGVSAEPPPGPVQLLPAVSTWEPGAAPVAGETALRIDTGGLPAGPRLTMAAGDRLAFGGTVPREAMGREPVLTQGPFATVVWQPQRPGTYSLPMAAGVIALEVTERPALVIHGPPDGARLTGRTRLAYWVAGGLGLRTVTLLSGDRPLGTWPAPGPTIWLDPLLLDDGAHLLRLVGVSTDGEMVVSPPVTVVVE